MSRRPRVTLESPSLLLWVLVCVPLGHRDRVVNMRRSATEPDAMLFEHRCERCRRRAWEKR